MTHLCSGKLTHLLDCSRNWPYLTISIYQVGNSKTPVPVNLNNLTSRKSWHRDEVCFSLRFFLIVPELNKPCCNSRFQKNNIFSGVLVSIKTKVECRKLVPQNHGKKILYLKKYFFKKKDQFSFLINLLRKVNNFPRWLPLVTPR